MLNPAQPTTLDRLAARPARTKSLTFALDPNEGAAFTEARSHLLISQAVVEQFTASARDTPAATLAAAQRSLREAQAAYDALVGKAVTFTVHLRAIEVERLEELIAEHRPTQAQIREARARNRGNPAGDPNVNAETYLPALMAEAITSVELSDDPDNPLRGQLTIEQATTLLAACSHADCAVLGATAEALARSSTHLGG